MYKKELMEYSSQIADIYELAKSGLNFEDIHKIQSELKLMPRPVMSKQQSMDCEMRLQDKWRKYLSVTFPDEYINPVSIENMTNDYITEISDTQELLNDHRLIEHDPDNDDDDDDDDSKMPELVMDCDCKMIGDIMDVPIIDDDDDDDDDDNDNMDINNTQSFIRTKHHRRSSNSFIKTPSFLDNLNPFWSLDYDSGNELELSDDNDHSRNSNSCAIVHKEENETEDVQ